MFAAIEYRNPAELGFKEPGFERDRAHEPRGVDRPVRFLSLQLINIKQLNATNKQSFSIGF